MAQKLPRGPQFFAQVTKDLIDSAVRGDSGHCMIAEAVKAARPEAEYVSVDIQTIRFSDRGKRLRYIYLTPRVAADAILDFDQGVSPEPFSFRLRNAHVLGMRDRDGTVPNGLGKTHVARSDHDGPDGVPRLVGGQAPKKGALSFPPPRNTGRRREFGLRQMSRRLENSMGPLPSRQ